jgi:hypothetical protein
VLNTQQGLGQDLNRVKMRHIPLLSDLTRVLA